MTLIINPGSRTGTPGAGWTSTHATARAIAEDWLRKMHAEGMTDVELLDDSEEHDGRWTFTFRHKATGAAAQLETHGIDDINAYQRQHLFAPRIYWNGSSTSDPELEDFAASGFTVVRTYTPMPHAPVTWSEDAPAARGTGDPRPTVISLYAGGYGTTMSERPNAYVTFARDEDGEDGTVFYEGTIPQSTLFRTLLAAGLLRRRVDPLNAS